jgi:DNA helicase IV
MAHLKPSRLAVLLKKTLPWELSPRIGGVVARLNGTPVELPYATITDLDETSGWLWSTLRFRTAEGDIFLPGAPKVEARNLIQKITPRITTAVTTEVMKLQEPARRLFRHLDTFLTSPKYLAQSDLQNWLNAVQALPQPELVRLRTLLNHRYLDTTAIPADLAPAYRKLQDILVGPHQGLVERNANFVKRELLAHIDFFDLVERKPLTDEQRKAAVILEDRNLLIAAAGSGKSSTVVAKIGYAIKTGLCQPNEILAVVFNRNAREELEVRLAKRLPEHGSQVAACTFHKLGKEIIAEVEGKQPTPAPWEDSPQTSAAFIERLVEGLLDNPEFLSHWLLFRTVCFRPNRELAQFKDQRDYDRYLREVGEERDGHRGILTLNGELVRSMEEVAIANWLYLNGVNYQYERPYQFETADRQHRQYFPDFYYPDVDLYHEHFALDDNGKPLPLFKGDYEQGVIWKRALHTDKGTALIETTSAMYRQGELFTHLKHELESRGVVFRQRPVKEILDRLNQKQTRYAPFLRTFITHLKSNGFSFDHLQARASEQRDRWRATIFLKVFEPVWQRYQEALVAAGFIDFEDMVRRAADYVASGQYRHPYQLILVDEFQDISQAGGALIKAMLAQNPRCKLFAVGDDWQSINRFAGADIEIMANFASNFGNASINYLTRTFRSNQGISDVAAAFVQANPQQYRKEVRATDKNTEDVIQIIEYSRDEDVDGLLDHQLGELAAIAAAKEKSATVFILARYNHLKPDNLKLLQARYQGQLKIEFKSAHRSKGLEADYVILLGMNSGSFSFPSQIEDDPLLDMVMPARETFPHAEERRLFYVALTRARHKVILFTRTSRISRFVPELLITEFHGKVRYGTAGHAAAKACPKCGVGVLREKNGKFGWFLGCSVYPACQYTEKIPGLR